VDGLEDRQRVDRWIEESQYLIGRMIPGLLDDRERLRTKLEASEQECAKLRQEVAKLGKEVNDLQSETQYFRTEHTAMAEALKGVIDHVSQIQKPLNDVFRRLQITQPPVEVVS
jgi:predicted nuclease with TOPRIM domain